MIDITQVLKIAENAGIAIMKIHDKNYNIGFKDKGGENPLTEADKVSNEIIIEGLKEIDDSIPILSEENEKVDYSMRKDWNKLWLVDPLDGTKEFIKKNGEFTVNIALVENGCPVLGVVYVPVTKEIYYSNGKFSFKIYPDGMKEKINAKERDNKHIVIVVSKSHLNDKTNSYIDSLKDKYEKVDIVSAGSSLKLCLVAEGKADIYPRIAPTMEWDTAAAHAVVKTAGKNVYDYDTGEELMYNKEDLLNPFFIVR